LGIKFALAADFSAAWRHFRRKPVAPGLLRQGRLLRSLFVLSILVPGMAAALTNRFAALLLYLWFALFRPQDWLWIDITRLRLSMVLGAMLIGPSLLTGIMPNVTHPLSAGSILFLVCALVSQMGAFSPDIGWLWIDFLVRLLLVCTLLVTLASTPRRIVAVLAVIACSLGIHAGKAGFAWLVIGGVRFADGLSGAFVDNNGYAMGTVMIMPLLVATAQNVHYLFEGRWPRVELWTRRAIYAMAFFCTFTVIGTYSRGGFLSLSAAVLMFIALQRRRAAAFTALGTVVLLALFIVPLPSSYTERLSTIRTYEEIGEDSAMSRPHFWKVAVRMAEQNFFGVGLRGYDNAYDFYDFLDGRYGRGRSVHSSHYMVLAELGYPGAVVWGCLLIGSFLVGWRIRARASSPDLPDDAREFVFTCSNALMVSMAGFTVGGSFLALALNDLTWLTFALLAALDRWSHAACVAKRAETFQRAGTVVRSEFAGAAAFSRPIGEPTA
jgi:probable O-glycosylation ligase (exosortase A-associated)